MYNQLEAHYVVKQKDLGDNALGPLTFRHNIHTKPGKAQVLSNVNQFMIAVVSQGSLTYVCPYVVQVSCYQTNYPGPHSLPNVVALGPEVVVVGVYVQGRHNSKDQHIQNQTRHPGHLVGFEEDPHWPRAPTPRLPIP